MYRALIQPDVPVDNLKNVENENTPKDNFFSLHLY
jgi:hypothetical protein